MDDVTARGIRHRGERHARPEVHLGEPLEQFGCAALDEAGASLDDEVIRHADRIGSGHFDGQCDARVPRNIAHFGCAHEVSDGDLLALDTDPHGEDLGALVGVEGTQMPQSSGAEGVANLERHRHWTQPTQATRRCHEHVGRGLAVECVGREVLEYGIGDPRERDDLARREVAKEVSLDVVDVVRSGERQRRAPSVSEHDEYAALVARAGHFVHESSLAHARDVV